MIFSTPVTVKYMKKNLNIMQPCIVNKFCQSLGLGPSLHCGSTEQHQWLIKKKFTFENCSITEPIFLSWLHIEDINNFGKCFTKVSFERLNTTSRERLNLIWEKAPADQQTAEMSVFTLLFSWQKEAKIK